MQIWKTRDSKVKRIIKTDSMYKEREEMVPIFADVYEDLSIKF